MTSLVGHTVSHFNSSERLPRMGIPEGRSVNKTQTARKRPQDSHTSFHGTARPGKAGIVSTVSVRAGNHYGVIANSSLTIANAAPTLT